MYGGSITKNKSTTSDAGGGGVCNLASFTMSGGTISGNSASQYGGGVFTSYNAVFTMSGGTISGNSASLFGGGVCNLASFTMSGGTITGNSSKYGGGVFTNYNAVFTMPGGTISGNSASLYGGGVFTYYNAVFTMSGGIISGNSASLYGGGVYNFASFTMSGGIISGNNVGSQDGDEDEWLGGGVFNAGTFNVSGTPVIKDNVKNGAKNTEGVYTGGTANNVYLFGSKTITVESGKSVESGAAIYITGSKNQAVVTGTTSSTGFYSDNADLRFVSDSGGLKLAEKVAGQEEYCICGDKNCTKTGSEGHELVTWTQWTSTTSLPTTAGNYYLTDNVTLSNTWAVNNDIKLCLNGQTITGPSNGDVITVNSGKSLTITDWADTAGKITHAENAIGRGIKSYGSLTLWKGSITGNTISTGYDGGYPNGGGVYVTSTGGSDQSSFTMYGGEITGNSSKYGGGVYVNGSGNTFTMNGGNITQNTATDSGGGVYNDDGGKLNMTGGSITQNTATTDGGGVCNYNKSTFNMSGAPIITGNKKGTLDAGTENNVYIYRLPSSSTDYPITVNAALNEGAKVGITGSNGQTVVKGYTVTNGVFSSDDTSLELVADGDNLKLSDGSHTHTYGNWTSNSNGTHSRKCTVEGCTETQTENCSGGKATCKDKAVCTVCKQPYGTVDTTNHGDNLKHVEAKAATETAKGNIEYWHCDGCDKYYSDKDATKEATITIWSTVPATDLTLSKKELTLVPSGTTPLSATVTPANSTDSVTWSSSAPDVVTVSGTGEVKAVGYGTATITAKAGSKTATCEITVVCGVDECQYYDDIEAEEWYHPAVDYVTEAKIMQGHDTGDFAPYGKLTRAEMAQILYNYQKNVVGKVEQGKTQITFSDVKSGEWYEKAIQWASSNDIILGDGAGDNNTFRPDAAVSREEMVTMLYRYMVTFSKKLPLPASGAEEWKEFPDAKDVADWAETAFAWAVHYGVIEGDDGYLRPQNTATRAQAAKIVMVAVKQ